MKQTPSSSISPLQAVGLGLLSLSFFFPTSSTASTTLDDYLKAFKDKRVDIRRAAIEQLLGCITEDERPIQEKKCPEGGGPQAHDQLITAIIELLPDPDPKIRVAAIVFLNQSTDARAVRPIARLLRDQNDEVRAAAVGSFYLIKPDAGIVRELERLLMDKNKRVRMGAAESLGFSGTKKSLSLLRGVLAHETDNEVRELYAETIRVLENRLTKKKPGEKK